MRRLGALGRGFQLGQEPFPRVYRAVVARAIGIAWDVLVGEPRGNVAGEAEKVINIRMQQLLNELRNSSDGVAIGFHRGTFESLPRGGEQVSATGAHLEKRPDLTFRLQKTPVTGLADELYALFVECKIISTTPKLYYDEGMARFLNGEYAPCMQHGMMVAYVRNGATVASMLVPFLGDPPQSRDVISLPKPVRPQTIPPVHVSEHKRRIGRQSARVSLDHVWLQSTR